MKKIITFLVLITITPCSRIVQYQNQVTINGGKTHTVDVTPATTDLQQSAEKEVGPISPKVDVKTIP